MSVRTIFHLSFLIFHFPFVSVGIDEAPSWTRPKWQMRNDKWKMENESETYE
jgi:hypothetical protein